MKIIIVGGGSSGWLTAAYMSNNIPNADITVIDKEVGNPVGVGEATILNFDGFMLECGFPTAEWFYELDATIKTGIMFPGWVTPEHEIWHPFYTNVEYPDCCSWDVWAQTQHLSFKEYGTTGYKSSILNKVDMQAHDKRFGYHVDCSKMVNFIQRKLDGRINWIKSAVVDIKRDGNLITNLVLNNGEEHSADLYVDCTGFASILKTPKKVDITGRLFCNTAIAGHVQYIDKDKEMRPYVISEAVDHGWIWQIPTRTRFGTGLVFNKDITDIETAKDFLVNYWQGRIDKDKLRVIDWTPNYTSNMWQANVVSIGLSAGFIEPLESTGLFLIQVAIKRLTEKIKFGYYDDVAIDFFNAQMTKYFEDGIDFVNMHYSKTQRTEPFWQYVKETQKESGMQQHYMSLMVDPELSFKRLTPPGLTDHTIFSPVNWFLWLVQLGYPVFKSMTHVHPARVEFLTRLFERNEHVRVLRSLPHQSAIDIILLEGMNNGYVPIPDNNRP